MGQVKYSDTLNPTTNPVIDDYSRAVAGYFSPLNTRLHCELSAGVGSSDTVTLRDRVMPVTDGFIGWFVWIDGGE